MHTQKLANSFHYATMKLSGIQGGFFGQGKTVQEAIQNVFDHYNRYADEKINGHYCRICSRMFLPDEIDPCDIPF